MDKDQEVTLLQSINTMMENGIFLKKSFVYMSYRLLCYLVMKGFASGTEIEAN